MATKENAQSSRTLMNRLLEHRIVMLSEPVMPKPAQRLMAQLLLLDAQDSKKPIHFYINTPGGSISDGFAIFDTVRFLSAPVITVCTGLSASMGTILMLSPPDKRNRVCLPNTRFMIHQPSSAYRGSAADIEIGAREILKLRDRLVEIYVQETKMDEDRIRADLNRDYWMTSEEAVKYGLCDRVVKHVSDLG
ncbi:MAG TPA: ATP-dependent Clp protease proteolytic subunit [Planctomycetota bacterium]|nr:ATP-dependent Clp protease proteolytic subunit [Planctomycetota bacterium]